MKFSLVAAADKNMGIGINNRLPWRLKTDLKFFSELTSTAGPGKINTVIMGRKTWESLPKKSRPLKDRINIILSRNLEKSEDNDPEMLNKKIVQFIEGSQDAFARQEPIIWATSLDEALQILEKISFIDKSFVIGGANVYSQAIEHPFCEKIYLTEVDAVFDCDAFFPKIPASFKKESHSDVITENGLKYQFVTYIKDYSRRVAA